MEEPTQAWQHCQHFSINKNNKKKYLNFQLIAQTPPKREIKCLVSPETKKEEIFGVIYQTEVEVGLQITTVFYAR